MEQNGRLLLHSRSRPRESARSARCLCWDSCPGHTKLLLNPVCHISGKKGKLEGTLQHSPRIKRRYMNKDEAAAGPDNSFLNLPVHGRHKAVIRYKFKHKRYVCEHCQDALIWVFLFVQMVQNKALTLSTLSIIQRIIAPSNCLQTSITIGALDYSHTHKHTYCPDGRQMFNRQGQGVHAVIVCSTISQYSQQCSDRHIHINPGNFLWNGNHVLFLQACLCLFYLFLVPPFTLSVSLSLSRSRTHTHSVQSCMVHSSGS